MTKKEITVLSICVLLSISLIAALYGLSPMNGAIYRGDFRRSFERTVSKKSILDIDFNSFYIAGVVEGNVYLGNITAPLHLLRVNTSLTDSQHSRLKVMLDRVKTPERFRLSVALPYFFMTHGIEPQILRGKIGEWVARPIMHDSAYYFVEAVPISASTFGLRSYNLHEKGYELAKKNLDSVSFNSDILVKQIDGLFCVDGKLHYDKTRNRLAYLHFYRNEFSVIDTTMNLLYRGHTLDTFSHALIKVAKLKHGNESMLSSPPMMINGLSCVDNGKLFVQSAILARNEDHIDFSSGAVIDSYDLLDGSYVGSFHLPNYDETPIRDFRVDGTSIFVLSGNYLIRYELE